MSDTHPKQKHVLVPAALRCLVAAGGNVAAAEQVAAQKVSALPVLQKIFERAAVGATPLGATDPFGYAPEVFRSLLVDELRGLLARFTKFPSRIKVPTENSLGGNAAWVGQGLATPVVKTTSATTTLDIFQIQVLSVLTRELFRFGTDPENTFMRLLRDDVSRFLATALFDSTKAATSANPASLTSGATRITSTGSTAAQRIADLTSMIANIITAMVDPVWVMQSRTFYSTAAALGGVGLPVTRNSLLGIPVVLLSGMPKEVVLVDCASVAYASDEQAELSVSTDASIEMSDSPSSSGISGTGASLVSFMQSGLVGVQATLTMNFANMFMANTSPNVPSGIVYMTTSY
jgi:hypothetical protein